MVSTDMRVSNEQLRRRCDPAVFEFESTADIQILANPIGQDRAVNAIAFGIDIVSPGYHIFALGPGGTGKKTMVTDILTQKSSVQEVPDDWCYVNCFDKEDTPIALRMKAGKGRQFKADIQQLIDDVKLAITEALESEEYQTAHEIFLDEFKESSEERFSVLEEHAAENDIKVVTTPNGVVFIPTKDGKTLKPKDIAQLDDVSNQRLEIAIGELQEETRDIIRRMRQLEQEAREKQRQLEHDTADFATAHLFEDLQMKYSDNIDIKRHLALLQIDVLDNLPLFYIRREQQSSAQASDTDEMYQRYQVNLLVDNSETEGAPVILEGNAHYHNLIGRIEHEVHQGALVTNFTMIKAGALMRANGGYLVLEARNLLTKPFAWDALKAALKTGEIRMGMMAEEHQVFLTHSLQPGPIPLEVRVVLIGDPIVYYLLYELDEDFRELFKVKADFASDMTWDAEAEQLYASFIAKICETQQIPHFTPSGVAMLVEESSRLIANKEKLAIRFGDIVDLIQQAAFQASHNGHQFVIADHVRKACAEKRYRNGLLEERLQEMILNGTLLIDTEGATVGQINGLAVLKPADYSFGKPSRITASTYAGSSGMVNIDREIELGGPIHNKGVLILSGYLGSKYAREIPLVLSASITFEQVYDPVDGDSASSTELYALLSSLSGYPIRQDLAVTGSVNQHGKIQAIGGANEKIEGFYDVCRIKGLTGTQGVIIPESNLRHLMLREDVVEAVREGQFHIYAVSTVDEGIELLTGFPAGERQDDNTYPVGTVHRAVQDRLNDLANSVKSYNQKTTAHLN